jgi:hypothetical protein
VQYSEAFSSLGYRLLSPRQDWTAEKDDGVCITIWQSEMPREPGRPWLDTRIHCGPIEKWGNAAGNKKRIEHISRAVKEFGGKVDVIIVRGRPGEGVDEAFPWRPENRKGHYWKISNFDPQTGHFRAETFLPSEEV